MLSSGTLKCLRARPHLLILHVRPNHGASALSQPARMALPLRIPSRQIYTRKLRSQFDTSRFREAYRKHPILIPLGCISVAASFVLFGYIMYIYLVDVLIPYQTFPDPVAKELRKAIYYDKGHGKDPRKALKHYVEALTVAKEIGMEGFSKEYIGMVLRVADFMERLGAYDQASQILENVQKNCYRWVDEAGDQHFEDGHRTRIYKMAIQVGVKLGQIYGVDEVDMPEEGQVALSKAVEHLLREQQRREKEGVKDGEGEWLNDEEVGAALEELGNSYIGTQQPELAFPLFLQALSLCPPNSCHSAMLMNSVSAALSSQNPSVAAALVNSPDNSKIPIPSATEFRAQAEAWATKALQVAQSLAPPSRTEECDQACAVATFNLGELAEMSGDLSAARKLFEESMSLSKGLKFEEGIKHATLAIARLHDIETS